MTERFKTLLDSISQSSKEIQVLPLENLFLNHILAKYDLKTDSLLGTIVLNSGGIVIDNWIRIYGAGKLDFEDRNNVFPYDDIVVGEDILGGLFVILENGNIGYFAPDTLEIEDMDINFSQFMYWCIQGDTDTFYIDYRWNGWKKDIKNMDLNNGISFYPFLWAEADSLEARERAEVPIKEIIGLEFEFEKQIYMKENSIYDK